jgi:hypothetical protein
MLTRRKMVKEHSLGKMEMFIMVIMLTMREMATVNSHGMTALHTKENGRKACSTEEAS